MTQLVKIVEGSLIDEITDNVICVKSVIGEIQREDYININGFIAYLQDLSEVQVTSALTKPITFGLKNNRNIQLITLNIDY
jgi:hypothetical protein